MYRFLLVPLIISMPTLWRYIDLYFNTADEIIEQFAHYINKFVEKVSPVFIQIGYNVLYFVSLCQIQVSKTTRLCKKYLKDKNIFAEERVQIAKLIDKHCELYATIGSNDVLTMIKPMYNETLHTGMIICDKDIDTGCLNIMYCEKLPEKIDFKLSNVRFMTVTLEYNSVSYTIDLKTDKANYYIVNNSLNQNFFKYYLKNVLNVELVGDNFDYKLTILDNNVNFVTLSPDQTIVINENDYTIYTPVSEEQNTRDKPSLSAEGDKFEDFIKLETPTT